MLPLVLGQRMQFGQLKRREFISLLGGAAVSAVGERRLLAQQPERMRRIGVLMAIPAEDAEARTRIAAFQQSLQQLGWIEGRNLQIDYRWAHGKVDEIRKNAVELAALAPDVILASGSAAAGPLLQTTRSVPVVFVIVPDPIGAGFVDSLAKPGGNATGFIMFEYGISGKWVELLKQVAPSVRRAAVIRDPTITAGIGQFGAIQSVAPALGVEVSPINVRDAGEIERSIEAFSRSANGGLIVTASALAIVHRELIVSLAAQASRGLLPARPRRSRRPDLVWARPGGSVPAGRELRQSNPQRREARRSPGTGAGEIRNGHQSQDGEGPRHCVAADRARTRG
jgi:putative ABC transport system substrate-binding protein